MDRWDKLADALAGFITAKKFETLMNTTTIIIGAGLTILMIAWLIHQIRAMWGV